MKSLLMLWQVLAEDLASKCCTSATMDVKTVRERSEHEGLSFVTIALPQFGKDFEKSLDSGCVDRRLFTGFRWRAGLPRFLGGFLDLVFDRSSGCLLDEPSIDAIQAVRQLSLFMAKIALPCSDARVKAAMLSYVECEKQVKEADLFRRPVDSEAFGRISAMLYRKAFVKMDREIHNNGVSPRHGPGSTADRLSGNGKYNQQTWPSRLDKVFPCSDYLLPSPSYYSDLDRIDLLEPGAEIPVKVISVPKTLKAPRIIGVEPTAMQYLQQGVLPVILAHLGKTNYLSSMLGFDDQVPNQDMAREGSLTGTLATLDLSEASDRVSNQLVRAMFKDHLHLHSAVDSTRSRKAHVLGKTIRLSKFASMGSALCFPVEAMVFLAIVFVGIERGLRRPLRPSDIKNLIGKVRIYGDDIIVPVEYVHPVVAALEDFGLRVNHSKSFWTGRFRESCGKEFYAGHDVSIVKVRTELPSQREHASEVISTVSLRNQLYYSGCWKTCQHLDTLLTKVLKHFPIVESSSSVLGRQSVLPYKAEHHDYNLHNPLVRGWVVVSRIPSDPLDGPGALLKFFLKRGGLPSVDEDHLERAGRPQSVNIKLRWKTPF